MTNYLIFEVQDDGLLSPRGMQQAGDPSKAVRLYREDGRVATDRRTFFVVPERNGTLIEHGSFQPPPKVTASVVTGKAVLAGLFPKPTTASAPATGTASSGGGGTTIGGPAAAAAARTIEGEADIAGEDGA